LTSRARSGGEDLIIADRRKAVAELRLRGLTLTEIVKQLPELGIKNGKTNKPWGFATIFRDAEEVEFEWKKHAIQSLETHKAQILAELRAVKAAAWAENKLGIVLNAIDKEVRILGLNSPEMIALVQAKEGKITRTQAETALSELAQRILKLKSKAGQDVINSAEDEPACIEGKVTKAATE
jgi:hypothetical protein